MIGGTVACVFLLLLGAQMRWLMGDLDPKMVVVVEMLVMFGDRIGDHRSSSGGGK